MMITSEQALICRLFIEFMVHHPTLEQSLLCGHPHIGISCQDFNE